MDLSSYPQNLTRPSSSSPPTGKESYDHLLSQYQELDPHGGSTSILSPSSSAFSKKNSGEANDGRRPSMFSNPTTTWFSGKWIRFNSLPIFLFLWVFIGILVLQPYSLYQYQEEKRTYRFLFRRYLFMSVMCYSVLLAGIYLCSRWKDNR